jgi:3-oxoacyl-[acyl-carrier-protein] synthase III
MNKKPLSILAIATKFPTFKYSIKELTELLSSRMTEEARDFFVNSLGISTVYHSIDYNRVAVSDEQYVTPHINLSDLYVDAAKECLDKSMVSAKQVSKVIVVNDNLQALDPSVTNELMCRLSLPSLTVDFNLQGHACSSLTRAIHIANSQPDEGYTLVLIGNYYSPWFFDMTKQIEKVHAPNEINSIKKRRKDFNTCNYFLQFSDNATALLISHMEDGPLNMIKDSMTTRTGVEPDDYKIADLRIIPNERYRVIFDMDVNTKHLRQRIKQLSKEAKMGVLNKSGIAEYDIKLWNLHTGGKVYVDEVREECGISYEKCKLTYYTMNEFGNTGASSSSILMMKTLESKALKHGEFAGVLDFGWGPKADAFLYCI